MPTIAKVHGIFILLHTRGEHPPPHIHARYNEYEASVDIMTGRILKGSLPSRALKHVQSWLSLHRREVLREWENMENKQPISRISTK